MDKSFNIKGGSLLIIKSQHTNKNLLTDEGCDDAQLEGS